MNPLRYAVLTHLKVLERDIPLTDREATERNLEHLYRELGLNRKVPFSRRPGRSYSEFIGHRCLIHKRTKPVAYAKRKGVLHRLPYDEGEALAVLQRLRQRQLVSHEEWASLYDEVCRRTNEGVNADIGRLSKHSGMLIMLSHPRVMNEKCKVTNDRGMI